MLADEARLGKLQGSFTALLGDTNELTQVGLGHGFDLQTNCSCCGSNALSKGPPEVRDGARGAPLIAVGCTFPTPQRKPRRVACPWCTRAVARGCARSCCPSWSACCRCVRGWASRRGAPDGTSVRTLASNHAENIVSFLDRTRPPLFEPAVQGTTPGTAAVSGVKGANLTGDTK
jgi:hypothetical protein